MRFVVSHRSENVFRSMCAALVVVGLAVLGGCVHCPGEGPLTMLDRRGFMTKTNERGAELCGVRAAAL